MWYMLLPVTFFDVYVLYDYYQKSYDYHFLNLTTA